MVFQRKIPSKFSHLIQKDSRFSSDSEWMNHCVLIAKHAHIWMAQISSRLNQKILKLDDIPDETFEELAQQGFNALWLVGLWQRSDISRSIKRNLGMKNSEASAYSIKSYQVADSLGGDAALEILKRRAARKGIRICVDIVPNHTAIDAELLIEHGDYYLSIEENPFPSYSFSGVNLSNDDRQEIYLEDHYLDQSDAAVVFKRIDTKSGEVRYFYHGNDGVDTPWNDTAQLDFTNQELRKQMIDELIRLAKSFPILRIDAAMLQVNQHIQRLWFPKNEKIESIATRQKKAMSEKDFAKMVSEEFWLEALAKMIEEAPDTLLLAEAYWTLESFFAHSIGMPRVYNIDFMRSLATASNQNLRESIKSVLAFDARLLGKQANYLSNPDEDSSRNTFGIGEKYFGLCTLLATLPGLPIFAHGQVEGFRERYAMDVLNPQMAELVDQNLVASHKRRIAPLLRRRDLFSGIEHFRFFDVIDQNGKILENIFCFVNGDGKEKVVVAFNNSKKQMIGSINRAAPIYLDNKTIREDIAEILELSSHLPLRAVDFFSSEKIQFETESIFKLGMPISLDPYEAKVFWRFEQLELTK